MQSRFQGLRVGKNAEFSFEPPMANSSMFVRPRNTASAARSFSIIVGIIRRAKVGQDFRRAGRQFAFGANQIFHRHRQATEQTNRLPFGPALVDRFGLPQGRIAVVPQKRFHFAIVFFDLVDERLRDFADETRRAFRSASSSAAVRSTSDMRM